MYKDYIFIRMEGKIIPKTKLSSIWTEYKARKVKIRTTIPSLSHLSVSAAAHPGDQFASGYKS